MSASAVYRPHAEAPAAARLSPCPAREAWEGLRSHRFELVSRGDFVPGLLHLPPESSQAPLPLLLMQHGVADSKLAPGLECASTWARDGLAVAAIDLPLHGERSSPKLSKRLHDGIARIGRGDPLDAQASALLEEFARQSTSDLVRTIDALGALPEIAADRIGFLGFGLGAVVGCYLLAHDSRVRAAVLVGAGAGRGPSELDAATWLARASQVAVLVVDAEEDARVPAEASKALFEAAPEPRRMAMVQGDARMLSEGAADEIRSFLEASL